ncbi:glycosyl hydrolase [Aureococcus anophagefferens]|nr:glycosyl hydrolase [Aureococcus anophagefferens]
MQDPPGPPDAAAATTAPPEPPDAASTTTAPRVAVRAPQDTAATTITPRELEAIAAWEPRRVATGDRAAALAARRLRSGGDVSANENDYRSGYRAVAHFGKFVRALRGLALRALGLRDAAAARHAATRRAAAATLAAPGSDLNGSWRFALFDSPTKALEFVERGGAAGDAIDVPGAWQTLGYDTPVYTNIQYPIAVSTPPVMPRRNTSGVYARTVVPGAAAAAGVLDGSRRCVLHVGAADNAAFVFAGGAWRALWKDARLPGEVDVTEALRDALGRGDDGLEVVCVVVRWTEGSYLEDQDAWKLSGLIRDVYALYPPSVSVFDVSWELAGDGAVAVAVDVAAVGRAMAGRLRVALRAAGELPSRRRAPRTTAAVWSPERPYVYVLTVELLDDAQTVLQAEACYVARRDVAIGDDGVLRLNGARLTVAGVNRHETCPVRGGPHVRRDDAENDAALLKAGHFNCVRLSHYPQAPAFYAACDRCGLLVVDEANVETHGWAPYPGELADCARWREAYFRRVQRMVLRDRSHPCVFCFSLGNEAGYGGAHDDLAAWLRSAEPTRLVHYEPASWAAYEADAAALAPAERGRRDAAGPPAFRDPDMPRLQGGFIWDLADQGLRKRLGAHLSFWAYGGDFGELPTDETFCLNGLLFPDRSPKPSWLEAAAVQRPFGDPEVVGVEARGDSRRLVVRVPSRASRAGVELARPSPPRVARACQAALRQRRPGKATLTVAAFLRRDEAWALRGAEVAQAQVVLGDDVLGPPGAAPPAAGDAFGLRVVSATAAEIRVESRCGTVGVTIDADTALPVGYDVNGEPALLSETPAASGGPARRASSFRSGSKAPVTAAAVDRRSALALAALDGGGARAPLHADELPVLEAEVGYGELGFRGKLGYEGKPVVVGGAPRRRSLSAHANSVVVLDLGAAAGAGSFSRLTGRVAINDDQREDSIGGVVGRQSPLVFEVRDAEKKLARAAPPAGLGAVGDGGGAARLRRLDDGSLEFVARLEFRPARADAKTLALYARLDAWHGSAKPGDREVLAPLDARATAAAHLWAAARRLAHADVPRGVEVWVPRVAPCSTHPLGSAISAAQEKAMDDDEEDNGARAAPSPRPPGDALLATCEASTRVGADGSVSVSVADLIFRTADAAKAAWPPLPRLGLALRLPPSVGDVAWLGLGPHECYPDRKAAALFGAFGGTVDDLFVPYLRPSECGNRTGVERLALASPSLALGIAADFGAFDFSAARHGDRDLVEARHQHELGDGRSGKFRSCDGGAVHVHVDRAVQGVGGDDSWTACVHEPYLVVPPPPEAPAAFEFSLDAVPRDADDARPLLDAVDGTSKKRVGMVRRSSSGSLDDAGLAPSF